MRRGATGVIGWCAWLMLVAACAPSLRATEPECGPAAEVDVLAHDVDLTVSLEPRAVSGQGRLELRTREATSSAALDANELTVLGAQLAGAPVPFRADGKRLCLRLPRKLAAGERFSLDLRWTARVDRDTPHFANGQLWAGYLTSAWLPTVLDAAQRATLNLRVLAPPGLTVAASGVRAPVTDGADGADGARRFSFTVDRPVAPFLYAFAVGDFQETTLEVEGVVLRALGPRGKPLDEALATTAAALKFLHEQTGTPYPMPEYTQVFVDGDAAQESAGLALLSASSLDDLHADPKDDWIFSHELAHQWFAVLVGCADFSDFWLNEGFATFLVGAFKEARFGRAAYEAERQVWTARSTKAHAQGRDAPVSLWPLHRHVRESELQARGITYFRGALVLDALRQQLGDEVFWSGLRGYTGARAGRLATSEDLRTAFEVASGRDLQSFFSTWVYASGPVSTVRVGD